MLWLLCNVTASTKKMTTSWGILEGSKLIWCIGDICGYLHRQLFGILTDHWFPKDTNSSARAHTHTRTLIRKRILHEVAQTSNLQRLESKSLTPRLYWFPTSQIISNLHNQIGHHWNSWILKWLDKKLHLGSAVLGRTGDWCSTWATRSLT